MDVTGVRELIGDIELLKPILDQCFCNWEGIYTMMPFGSGEYVIDSKEGFSPFCKALREHPDGNDLCLRTNRGRALEAAEKGQVIHYRCHAGLLDIAAPIIVNKKCLATIFCGQRRFRPYEDLDAERYVAELETKLGIDLMQLWRETPPILEAEVDDVKRRLGHLTRYLSEQWKEKLELYNARKRLELQVRENEVVREAFVSLSDIPRTEEIYWERLNELLDKICTQFGAAYGAILEIRGSENAVPTLRAGANLPESFIGSVYPGNKEELFRWLEGKEPRVVPFDVGAPDSLYHDIAELAGDGNWPDEVAFWPVYFGEDSRGILCLFIYESPDLSESLSIQEELHILEPFLGQISVAYESCKLLQRERELVDLQGKWLQNVVHEVNQPIHGILGFAELLRDELTPLLENWTDSKRDWSYRDVETLQNGLESILWMALNASALARNFAWVAGERKKPGEADLQINYDFVGTLIGCVRDKQGQAKERRVIGPSVETATLEPFNDRVRLDKGLFKQAMRNLLDNAVKYAEPETTVSVYGEQRGSNLVICVKNIGLPIFPGEEEIIFERRTRGESALKSNVNGSGIGLSIAREILELHGGTVRTFPSKRVRRHGQERYETVFEVILPLIGDEEEKNA